MIRLLRERNMGIGDVKGSERRNEYKHQPHHLFNTIF